MSKSKYEEQKEFHRTDMKEMTEKLEALSDNEKMFVAGAIAALATRAEDHRSPSGVTA